MAIALPVALAAQAPEGKSWVLPPGSESAVARAFDGQTLRGWTFDGAEIRRDHVGLAFWKGPMNGKKWVEVRLVHPSAGAEVVGEAPEALKRAVTQRLSASGTTLPWM